MSTLHRDSLYWHQTRPVTELQSQIYVGGSLRHAMWELCHLPSPTCTPIVNGVLMLANENEREVFITAEPGVAENERPIFFEATIDGRPASSPVMLRVTPADS